MWRIEAANTALLVIDMQNDFVRPRRPMEVPAAREIIGTIQSLTTTCRDMTLPIMYTQHILLDEFDVSPLETSYNPTLQSTGMRRGTNGAEIVDELSPDQNDIRVERRR